MQGILMTPDSHKATYEKRKWQTRRLDHLKTINEYPNQWELMPSHESLVWLFRNNEISEIIQVKPRYRVGETVYVKEAYAPFLNLFVHDKCGFRVQYKLDNAVLDKECTEEEYETFLKRKTENKHSWDTPLFMPAWAARDFITITDVKAERLQDITEEGAMAEGASEIFIIDNPQLLYPDVRGYRRGFLFLWNSINKTYPWELNPWVFAYTYKLLDGKQ